MHWMHNQQVRFGVSKYRYKYTDFPHFTIKINIFFHSKESNYIISQDSGIATLRPLPLFSSESSTTTPKTVHVISRERERSLSYDDIQEAVRKPIRDYIQSDMRCQAKYHSYEKGDDDEFLCRPVIKEVWEKVSNIVTKYLELEVDLNIRMIYTYMYIVGTAMAISRSLPFEFCDVGGEAMMDCCAICLAEIGGAATFRMRCTHFFHAECLALWAGCGNSCPLCRMPMDGG